MGWNVNGLLVEGVVDPGLLPGRPRELDEDVDVGTMNRRTEEYGVAVRDGWTFIADPDFLVSFDAEAAQTAFGDRRVLTWVASSVTNSYGFAWSVGGETVRRVAYAELELVDEYGPELAAEADLPEPLDEDYIAEVMERFTGQSWGTVTDATYRVWRCTE